MSLFYYINLVKHKNFDSSKFLECLVIWNGGSTSTVVDMGFLLGKILPWGTAKN